MKEIVALLFLLCFGSVTFYFTATKRIAVTLATLCFAFSVIGGLSIANYDLIKRIKWKDVEIETFERQVTTLKEEALEDIRNEVAEQKESIQLLISNANDIREKLDVQKTAVESLLDRARAAEERLALVNQEVGKMAANAEQSRERIEVLHQASSELALLLTKITWLQIETKNEFGTQRANAAIQQTLADLNKIVAVVIPDAQERSRWVAQLRQSLPARQ